MNNNDNNIEQSIYRLFELTPIPTILSLPNGKLEYVNPALNKMLGYKGEHVYAKDVVITHEEDVNVNEEIRQRLIADPFTPIQIDKRYKHKDGHTIYAQLNIVAQSNENGGVERYISHIIELTPNKKLDAAEILLSQLLNQSGDAIYVVDPQYGQILNCNKLAYKRLGYSKEELLKLTVPDIHPDFKNKDLWLKHVDSVIQEKNRVVESQHTRKDGTHFPIEANISYTTVRGKKYFLAIVRDISRRKEKEQEIIETLSLDPLTKLPNRSILERSLDEMFKTAIEKNNYIAFMYIDLDNFKEINDTFGHRVGDGILVGTASRLKHCLRKSDVVTRIGGDEFLIIVNNLTNKELITAMANKLLIEFSSPFKIDSHLIKVNASIGVSIYSESCSDPHTLIQLADEAMYQAKKQSGTSIYYI